MLFSILQPMLYNNQTWAHPWQRIISLRYLAQGKNNNPHTWHPSSATSPYPRKALKRGQGNFVHSVACTTYWMTVSDQPALEPSIRPSHISDHLKSTLWVPWCLSSLSFADWLESLLTMHVQHTLVMKQKLRLSWGLIVKKMLTCSYACWFKQCKILHWPVEKRQSSFFFFEFHPWNPCWRNFNLPSRTAQQKEKEAMFIDQMFAGKFFSRVTCCQHCKSTSDKFDLFVDLR